MKTTLWVGTRKGAFALKSDRKRKKWEVSSPIFLGQVVNHVVPDPRKPGTLLMGVKTGHMGPTVMRSADGGKKWTEAKKPPAFAKVGDEQRTVESVFWISTGHSSEPKTWYAGTTPAGLFRSNDDGVTWEEVKGFNHNPERPKWAPGMGTPGGEMLHSILVDPRDKQHLYLGISVGGVFESRDEGRSWRPLNQGCNADFLPDENVEHGHDPHLIAMDPLRPDVLWQQNHCGIYRIERPSDRWERVGKRMPRKIGDIGFPIVCHPRKPGVAWVFPMDGTEVWPRTSVGGKPEVYATTNDGKSWKSASSGLPKKNAYFTVLRQAMVADAAKPAGVYFGTTQGEVWGSNDEGRSWNLLCPHLPHIFSLAVEGRA